MKHTTNTHTFSNTIHTNTYPRDPGEEKVEVKDTNV
jgi:hypothetical protein